MNLDEPSKFWRDLAARDCSQVQGSWKQTVATHYFTWTRTDGGSLLSFARLVGPQYAWLLLHTTPVDWIRAFWRSWRKPAPRLSSWQSVEINVLARLAWAYARRTDRDGLTRLTEPAAGDPFDIQVQGQSISQDLANSIVETRAMKEALQGRDPERIVEVGAGYGRNAFVLLHCFPNATYTVIDIEPALTLCRQYLTGLFPGRSLAFLSPGEVNSIPTRSTGLFLNISSFGEMLPAQVAGYFDLADRVTAGVFYHKQWKISRNLTDHVVLRRRDYPIPERWSELFNRTAKIQPLFFEAAYRIPG
jgi:putative sugar O-methyltransferase